MLNMNKRPRRSRLVAHQRGLSLVELMVGITIGLFVVAAASLVVTSQLTDNRRLLLELQVQQDLRATADVITRELRRAGGRDIATEGVWSEGSVVTANPYASITIAADNSEVRFDYERGLGLQPLGFKFVASEDEDVGVIQSFISTGWQDLTDRNTMTVTAFTVQERDPAVPDQVIPCARACDPLATNADTSCWPRLRVRAYEIEITAHPRSDPSLVRTVRSEVRLRNDSYVFGPGLSAAQACPT